MPTALQGKNVKGLWGYFVRWPREKLASLHASDTSYPLLGTSTWLKWKLVKLSKPEMTKWYPSDNETWNPFSSVRDWKTLSSTRFSCSGAFSKRIPICTFRSESSQPVPTFSVSLSWWKAEFLIANFTFTSQSKSIQLGCVDLQCHHSDCRHFLRLLAPQKKFPPSFPTRRFALEDESTLRRAAARLYGAASATTLHKVLDKNLMDWGIMRLEEKNE